MFTSLFTGFPYQCSSADSVHLLTACTLNFLFFSCKFFSRKIFLRLPLLAGPRAAFADRAAAAIFFASASERAREGSLSGLHYYVCVFRARAAGRVEPAARESTRVRANYYPRLGSRPSVSHWAPGGGVGPLGPLAVCGVPFASRRVFQHIDGDVGPPRSAPECARARACVPLFAGAPVVWFAQWREEWIGRRP